MTRLLLVVPALLFTSCGGGGAPATARETIEMKIRYSAFRPEEITVAAGTTVRFVIENTDPIDHEFIIGPQELHDRHETGTEQSHGAVPGEVSIEADDTAETTYTFTEPGRILYACHLPGHLKYGMKGYVTVTEAE